MVGGGGSALLLNTRKKKGMGKQGGKWVHYGLRLFVIES